MSNWVCYITFVLDAFLLVSECSILILKNWLNFSDGMLFKLFLAKVKNVVLFLDWEIFCLHIGIRNACSSPDSNICRLTSIHLNWVSWIRKIFQWEVFNLVLCTVVVLAYPVICLVVLAVEENVLLSGFFDWSNLFLELLECKFGVSRHPMIFCNSWMLIPEHILNIIWVLTFIGVLFLSFAADSRVLTLV